MVCCHKTSPTVYKPRRPEKTVLFEVIKKHYKTWHKKHEKVLLYVDKEFKHYLQCGILAHGFACAHCHSCHQNFLIAFSCKGRGVCPSCNKRNMDETAANLIENLIPAIPIRQWVISFPKRIRHFLQTDAILQEVLRIVVDEVRKRIISCSPEVSDPKFGAISFIQRFGNTLNLHPHFHLVVADGVFEIENETFKFYDAFLTPDDIANTQDHIHKRILKLFARRGWIEKDEVEKMLTYENSGFSLDAKVQIAAWDREGLERLIRYCSRPCFASENLRWNGPWLIYRLPKPSHTGQTFIQLEPLEFIERIAALIPLPRKHRHHYHGIFAPNAPQRGLIVASANRTSKRQIPPGVQETADKISKVSLNWATLLARIYEVNPLICSCGKEMKIVAIITHPVEIKRILSRMGWPLEAPEFEPPADFDDWNISQLYFGSVDGFPPVEYEEAIRGPDPPIHYVDPPHWEDANYLIYE
jgi:hypothetical protein